MTDHLIHQTNFHPFQQLVFRKIALDGFVNLFGTSRQQHPSFNNGINAGHLPVRRGGVKPGNGQIKHPAGKNRQLQRARHGIEEIPLAEKSQQIPLAPFGSAFGKKPGQRNRGNPGKPLKRNKQELHHWQKNRTHFWGKTPL